MELDTHLAIGLCHIALEGYSAEAAGRAFERAYELARQIGDPRKEIQALFGQWGHFWMRAEHDQAISLGRSLLAKTELLPRSHNDNGGPPAASAARCLPSANSCRPDLTLSGP